MALAGPRLDRPTGVGDEGRPRAASLTVAALITVGLVLSTALSLDLLGLVGTLGLAASLPVVGLSLLDRTRLAHRLAGHLCALGGAAVGVLVVGSVLRSPWPLIWGGLLLSLVGLTATWSDLGHRDRLERALRECVLSYAALLGSLVGFVLVGAAVIWTVTGLDWLVTQWAPPSAIAGLLVLCAGVLAAAHALVRSVPVTVLAPRSRRPAARRRVRRLRKLTGLAVLGVVVTVVVGLVGLRGFDASPDQIGEPTARFVGTVVTGPAVVYGLAVVGGAFLLVAVALAALNRSAGTTLADLSRRLSAALAGGLLSAVAILANYGAGVGVQGSAVLTGVVIGPVALMVLVGATLVTIDLGLVTDRALAPVLTAVGLALATVGTALSGVPVPIVFATALGTVVVWDLAGFGLGLTAEVGHRPDTRRLELVHAVAVVGLASVGFVLAMGVETLRSTVGSAVGSQVAMVCAFVGAVLLVFRIRSR